ncbi:MAG: DNA polymerase III subunit chi [Pseudomonadota bacterium]
MSEVWFYHLTDSRLEQALPTLVERCLSRQWNVVVQCGTVERRDALDTHLWTFRDESFIPHASASSLTGEAANQPVWLTVENDNPNGAHVRFLVDGAVAGDLDGYERGIYMFDGHDAEAVASARERWKAEKAAGHDISYWQQGGDGRWRKKA